MGSDNLSATAAMLGRSALFGGLTDSELQELASIAKPLHLDTAQSLFFKGDPGNSLYLIVRGVIRIFIVSENGRETTLNILKEGQVLGEIALLDGGFRTANAVAHEATELFTMERRHILPFLEKHPGGLRRMLVTVCERLRWVSDLLEDASFLELPQRLGKRLSLLARLFGHPASDGGIRIALELSQQDLAALMSVTRESINRQIRMWEQAGLLKLRKGYLVITDLDQFEQMFGQGMSADG